MEMRFEIKKGIIKGRERSNLVGRPISFEREDDSFIIRNETKSSREHGCVANNHPTRFALSSCRRIP